MSDFELDDIIDIKQNRNDKDKKVTKFMSKVAP